MTPPPLTGVKVLDLSRVLAGPYATMLMADLGADVIKVEAPWGDDTRRWGPPWHGEESVYFLTVNRGKRSIALDLRQNVDRQRLMQLVDRSDVMVESFRTGSLERWGLGYEEVLSPRNPRLILASLTGFGRTGPDRDHPGYATLIEAQTGLMHVTGDPDGPPVKLGVAMVDVLAGMHLLNGVTTALYERHGSGRGRRVDVSLLESAMSSLVNQAGNYLIAGMEPNRAGNTHPTVVPFGTFPTADRDVMITVGNDRQFVALVNLLGLPELGTDLRFTTNANRCENRDALQLELEEALRHRPSSELITAAKLVGVPIGPLNSVSEAFDHPQVQHHGMVHEVDHPTLGPLRTVRHPVRYDGMAYSSATPPPRLGEHTDEILREL